MKATFLILLISFFSCSEWKGAIHAEGSEGNPSGHRLKGYSNQVILDWNKITLQTMEGPLYSPLVGARMQAMVHIAMHDALNNIFPAFETYALHDPDENADPVAAAATAAHTVLASTFTDKKPHLDSLLQETLSQVTGGGAKERGILLGLRAGNAILALREHDGAFQNPIGEITAPASPGVYQAVPPTPFVFAPFWKTMQPFSLNQPDQFRVPALPDLSSERYAHDFNEVKSIGIATSTVRTEDETAYSKYWYEFSEIGWNRITGIAAKQGKLDLFSTARLFALVNMALVDSYTAGWDSKFHYDFWRPYTAIRAAETDGNEQTAGDADWEPLMDTPPAQDYPSTHSALGNAAATILASLLGDHTKFSMTSSSGDPENPTRTFKSFSQAAKENADSRVTAGIHFRFSCDAGLDLGKQVGEWTIENHLRPIRKNQ